MNIFTRFLSGEVADRRLIEFIAHWDALESLVIRVYKGKQTGPADEAEYRLVRTWLRKNYPRWQDALRPYWQAALVAGEPARENPFTRLLAAGTAGDFVGDWGAMQNLPAAREALNHLLLEKTGVRDS